MKKIFRLKWFRTLIGSILVTSTVSALLFTAPHASGASDQPEAPNEVAEKELYKTITVEQKKNSDLVLPGKVLSHESATVYPRRAGIVKDIYLDIGDPVREGQVIGLLLPQGVEGQSAALIAEKQARAKQAQSNYLNSQKIAQVAIENAERQLSGKDNDGNKNPASKVTNAQKNVEVARSNLKLSQDALEKKQIDVENILQDAKSDLVQEKNQIKTIVDTAFSPVDSLISTFDKKVSSERIEPDGIPSYLGATNSSSRRAFISSYNSFLSKKEIMDAGGEHSYEELNAYVEASLDLGAKSEELLRNSIGNAKLSSTQISNYTADILNKKNQILIQQEAYEDALNAYNNSTSSTDETLTRLRNQIEKDQKLLEYAIDIAENTTTIAVDNLSLVKVEEQQKVDKAETDLAVARAAVNVEYSKSGHIEIISPFSGVITKRHILVGDVISPGSPLFELVGVKTALSKKSRQEIKFGIDEQYYSLIKPGDEVEFFIPQKETVKYTATITRISPQIDPITHNILVQANINTDVSLPNHMNVRIVIPESNDVVYQIPSMLIKEDSGSNYIWILKDNVHQKLTIDVIAEDGELADVTGELTEETQLITSAPDSFINIDLNTEIND